MRETKTDFIYTSDLIDWNVIGGGGGKERRKLVHIALNAWQQYFWHAPDTSADKTATQGKQQLQKANNWDIHQQESLYEKWLGVNMQIKTNQGVKCSFGHVDSCLQAEM